MEIGLVPGSESGSEDCQDTEDLKTKRLRFHLLRWEDLMEIGLAAEIDK